MHTVRCSLENSTMKWRYVIRPALV